MIEVIESLSKQLKSLTEVITDICSLDNELVKSEKKEKILSKINSQEYERQQNKVDKIIEASAQKNH